MSQNKRSGSNGASILLASASPRRQALLQQIGVPFQVVSHQVEEILQDNEAPEAYVRRLALEKAQSGLDHQPAESRPVVLGSDTAVVCENRVLGKPSDRDDALRMLRLLSGRKHLVHSAVALVSRDSRKVVLSTTEVEFRSLESDEMEAYWDSGEPRDKAGGYAIQGLGAVFVRSLSGSYSGVMGLPLFETAQLLNSFAIPCWQPPRQGWGGQQ
ncbi:MAG: Maf family protein [Gammaproteobacteria bacterium]|jgi:septum formation protein